jgi:SRR1 protein
MSKPGTYALSSDQTYSGWTTVKHRRPQARKLNREDSLPGNCSENLSSRIQTDATTNAPQHDAWTIVTSKDKRRRHNPTQHSRNHTHSSSSPQTTSITQPDPFEVTRSHARIARCLSQLRDALFAEHVRSVVAASASELFVDESRVQRVVIAGLGNLDGTTERDVWRATWQVAVLLEIADALGPLGGEGIKGDNDEQVKRAGHLAMWAQDPAFTATDEVILEGLGIKVMAVPHAVKCIDSRTLLFVPFVDGVVLLPEILGGKDPAVYVGSDIEEVIEKMGEKDYAER